MNTYEQLLYLIRIPLILLSAVIIALIFTFSTPQLTDAAAIHDDAPPGAAPIRADIYAATLINHQALYAQPGVIDPAAFTQEHADALLRTDRQMIHPYAVRAQIHSISGTPVGQAITANPDTWEALAPIKQLSGIHHRTLQLPITIQRGDEREAALLRAEVLYES